MTQTTPTTILLIEDSASDVRLIEELLHYSSPDSFNVITAPTLSQGLRLLSANSVDVILLDLGLPASEGIATFRAIYKHASHLPIVVLTVSDDEAFGQQMAKEGAQRFISKDALSLGAPYAGVFTRMIRSTIEQKRTENELERIARFPEENPNPVMRIALTGHILYANEASDVLLHELGVRRDERLPADWLAQIAQASTRGEAVTIVTTAAERTFLLSIVPVKGERYVNVYGIDITKRKRAEEELQQAHEDVQALNEELQSKNEELRVANEELEQRVQERTEELAEMNEELQSTNEELRVSNEELRYETEQRTRAERESRLNAERAELLNRIITLADEYTDVHSYVAVLLDLFVNDLAFDTAGLRLRHGDIAELCESRGLSPEFIAKRLKEPISTPPFDRIYKGEPHLDERYDETDPLRANDARVVIGLGIPLVAHGEVIGSFGLGARRARSFTQAEFQTLVAIGHEAGTVIARLQANEAVKEHVHRTAALKEIVHVLNEAPDLPTLYDRALVTTVEYLHFDMGLIVTESASGHLSVQHTYNISPAFVEATNHIRIDEYPPARAIYREKKPVISEEAPAESVSARLGTHGAAVGIPFYSEEIVVGHIALYAAHPRSFTEEERQLFITIGAEFGTAVARLAAKASAEQYARQQKVITDIITAGNQAHDLQSACTAMLDAALELLDLTHGSVYLLNEAEAMVELQYARGFSDAVLNASRRFPLTTSYYPRVYKGESVFLHDYSAEGTEQFRPMLPDLHVMAIIPLSTQNSVFGNYVASSPRTHPFTDEERGLLTAIGRHAGTVIARLQAEETAKAHAQRAGTLTHIISAGTHAASLQSALAAMVDTTLELLSLDAGAIFIRDGDAMILQYARGYTDEQRAWSQRIPITQPRIARITDGTPSISDDYQADVSPEAREMNKDIGSMATIPLVAGEAVVGFYQLVSLKRQHRFADEERDLLVSIGQETGTVVSRLQTEEALVDSEARLSKLVEQSFDAVIIHSEGTIRFANGVAARMLKAARPAVLVGRDILEIPTSEFRALVEKRIGVIYESQASTDPVEMQFNALDGSVVDVEVMGAYSSYEGRPAAYVVFRDISERKRAAEELKRYSEDLEDLVEERTGQLKESEKQYRTLVETANSLIFTLDTEGTITFVNGYGARSLGYTPDELIGQNVMILIPETESSGREMIPYIDDVVAHPDEHSVSVNENITKDGRRLWFNWINKILTDEYGHRIGHLTIGNDVTEQKRTEKALQDAQGLASIGETAAMIGHDLRNPLQGLQYIVDLQKLRFDRTPPVKRSTEDWEKERELFDRISEQVFYMDKIVGDLQDYARPITPEHEEIQLNTIIDDALQSLPPFDGVELSIAVGDLTIDADPHFMHRVFANLILNATRAMPRGGTLNISATF
ncbi:MAG: GAF domain-containing protein [Halobacteriota archaeon]